MCHYAELVDRAGTLDGGCYVSGAVRDMFEKTNFYQTSDKQCVFLTVHDAVLYCQRLVNIVEGVCFSSTALSP